MSFDFTYYVMFNAEEPIEEYTPLVRKIKGRSHLSSDGGLHQFDSDIKGILPALIYCLHMPRNILDTMDIPARLISKGHSVPHNILLLASYMKSDEVKHNISTSPTLVISNQDCLDSARKFAFESSSVLGCVSISELSSDLLKEHWGVLTQLAQKSHLNNSDPLEVNPRLFSAEERKGLLPISFLANQLNRSILVERDLKRLGNNDKARLAVTLHMRSIISTLDGLEKQDQRLELDIPQSEYTEKLSYNNKNIKIPVVITLPGTAAQLQPHGARGKNLVIGKTDKEVIEILGIHRSVARSGFWLDAKPLPISIFDELRQLEHHFKEPSKEISNRYILKSMKRIGRRLTKHIGPDGVLALTRSSHVTAYTDFPIGLAILPGTEDPLCCIIPISYHPLTPLTRTLQMNLPKRGEHYIGRGRGFKVVVAECILPGDRIHESSVNAWKAICSNMSQYENVDIVYADILSLHALKKLLSEHEDADILVISAHGSYEEDIAGLQIGDEGWYADEDDFRVPPVVILSACHVAPRGVGAVTVNDMFLRAGAKAVLGTLIPVIVGKNVILTGRLFTYLTEAVSNGGQFHNLSDAWQWVVASNAIHEILETSERLKIWAHTRKEGKPSPLEEFTNSKSIGRLRNGFVYSDTIEILQELAKPDNIDVKAIISTKGGYFPESCFYTWSGNPENIILKEEAFEQAIKKGIFAGR